MHISVFVLWSSLYWLHTSRGAEFELKLSDTNLYASDAKVVRDKRSVCNPKITLMHCNSNHTSDPLWNWKAKNAYKVEANVEKGCPNSLLKYSWTLISQTGRINELPKGLTKAVVYIPRNSLQQGRYLLSVEVAELTAGSSNRRTASCSIRIVAENPIVSLTGGSRRSVPVGQSVGIASNVIDNNEKVSDTSKFKYHWECSRNNIACSPNSVSYRNDHMFILKRGVVNGTEYELSLKITNQYGASSIAKQQIVVIDGSTPLQILCKKNCPSIDNRKSNAQDEIIFEGFCGASCTSQSDFKWVLMENDQMLTSGLLKTENGYFSTVEKNTMKPNGTYRILLLLGDVSIAIYTIDTSAIELGACTVFPQERTSLFSQFEITCTGFEGATLYEVYQTSNGHEILLATGSSGRFKLLLGNGPIMIRIYNDEGHYQKLDLSIKPMSASPSGILKYVEDTTNNDSIPTMVRDNWQEKAVQTINCILENAPKDAEELKQFNLNVVKLLMKLPMYEMYDSLQLASITTMLTLPKEPADAIYQARLSNLCVRIARTFLSIILTTTHRSKQFLNSVSLQKYLGVCANYVMNDDFKEIDRKLDETATQSASVTSKDGVTEDYPNYDELDSEYDKFEFLDSTQNTVDIITTCNVAIGQCMVFGQAMHFINEEQFSTMSCFAPYLSGQLFQVDKTRVAFGHTDNVYLPRIVSLTVFNKNIFWWDDRTKNLATSIADLSVFTIDGSRKSNEGVNLFYPITKQEQHELQGSVSVPADLKAWIPENLDYNMTVHRLDAVQGSNLLLKFAIEKKIQVVVLKNRRPRTSDFDKSTKIEKSGHEMRIYPDKYETPGSWIYIAVLPDKDSVKESGGDGEFTTTYKIYYKMQSCMFWDSTSRRWLSEGCTVGNLTTDEILNCECQHLSTFMNSIGGTEAKEDPILYVPSSLEMKYSYIIPAVVWVVLALYLMALIIGTNRTKAFNAKSKIIFLADNTKGELYGYLLIIKTSCKSSSGTTSNICIQIHGTKSDSKQHILNYPDPHKILLQRGSEDWFILTADKYLGELQEIDIWFDCVGVRPSWYCESVHIYDLQTGNEWVFYVHDQLTVLENDKTFITVRADIAVKGGKWKEKLKTRIRSYKVAIHSWNIFNYSDDWLTYVRRVTIVFSIVLTTFSISLFVLGMPSLRLKDGLTYGHFSLYGIIFIAAFVSSVMSFFIHLGIQFLFEKGSLIGTKVRNKRLSSLCLAWSLLILLIIFNMTILIIFGFWVPYMENLLWICSVILALLLIALVYENIFALLKFLFIKTTITETITNYNMSLVIQETENQRAVLYKKFGDSLLRPYLRFKYIPLQKDKIKEKELREKARAEIAQLLKELFIFILYIVLLFMLLMSDGDYSQRMGNQEMKEMVVTTKHTRSMKLKKVHKYQDLYTYLNKTLIAVCHPDFWYEKRAIGEAGLMIDATNKLMGIVQLRQKRVVENYCSIPNTMNFLKMNCVHEYRERYSGDFEDRDYAGRLKDIWIAQNSTYTGSYQTFGEINWYSGTGYVARLGRNKYNSMYTLKYLTDNKWIDERSRTLFVDFWTYNPNHNLFNSVRLIFEKSATGLFVNSYSIFTARLLVISTSRKIYKFTLLALFILVNIKYVLIVQSKLFKARRKFFRSFWNIFDLTLLGCTVITAVVYGYRLYQTLALLDALETSSNNTFVSFAPVMYYTKLLTIMSAVMICMAIIRLWNYLRFGTVFRIMENTLVESRGAILCVCCYHFVTILAFTVSGRLMFGNYNEHFRDIATTMMTLVLLSLNLFFCNLNEFLSERGLLGYIYFVLVMLFTLAIYTMYITIIILYYTKSRYKFSNVKVVYSVRDFVRDELEYLGELLKFRCRRRLRGGQNTNQAIYPKSLEHRYADCHKISSSNLHFMSLIARGVIRNLRVKDKNLSSKELALIMDVVKHLLSKDSVDNNEIFFTAKDEHGIKLVPDKKVEDMERVANRMFTEGEKPTERSNVVIKPESNMARLQYFEDVLSSISDVLKNIVLINEN